MKRSKSHTEPNVLKKFAHSLGTTIEDWRIDIPEKFGLGYCTGYVFNKHIRMFIFNYVLNEDLVIENPDININSRNILFKFQNVFPDQATFLEDKLKPAPSVLIATTRLNAEVVIPIHTNTATINIEVDAGYLNELFDHVEISPVLQGLLENTQPLLFEQVISTSLQKIINEILNEPASESFQLFFSRVKAEELICRLLIELDKRDEGRLYDLNVHDIQVIYHIKEQILHHLATPPVIKELSVSAGMSPTKLKRLFKQIFGNSIFSYYQEFRMKQAARFLKQDKMSVSDVGYEMGFTNLSHFAKVFFKHTGLKPKQYSRSQKKLF